jgi:hypothetical protein
MLSEISLVHASYEFTPFVIPETNLGLWIEPRSTSLISCISAGHLWFCSNMTPCSLVEMN